VLLARPALAVVFDMDGVLLDTERLYTEATQEIVGRFGKRFDWSVKAHMIGRPARDSARYLVETLELPMTADEYLREREVLFRTLMPTAQALPGARELTVALRRAGVPIAVATSSARPLYDLKTSRHGPWFAEFDVVLTGDDPRIARGKPAPDIYLLAARELGMDAAFCVAIEDAPARCENRHTLYAVLLGALIIELRILHLQFPESRDKKQENSDCRVLKYSDLAGGKSRIVAQGGFIRNP